MPIEPRFVRVSLPSRLFQDARRRRADASIELRKQKKDDLLMKRRNINVNEPDDEGAVSSEEVVGEADNTEVCSLDLALMHACAAEETNT
jgi:hypothetical protein